MQMLWVHSESSEYGETGSGTDDRVTSVEYSESGSGTDDKTTTKQWSESGTGTDDRTTNRTGSIGTDTSNDRDFDSDVHEWGNWGISQTVQKLWASTYETHYKYNPYELMSDIFIKEMTDCVWI